MNNKYFEAKHLLRVLAMNSEAAERGLRSA
jgi:hypothetical protein